MLIFYTACVWATLNMNKSDVADISSVEDLFSNTNVQYGCIYSGSTMEFFRTSENTIYQQMFAMMESDKSVYTYSNQEGVEKVLKGKGNYAFFMESSAIEYITQRNCELVEIGRPLDQKGFGIALPKRIVSI